MTARIQQPVPVRTTDRPTVGNDENPGPQRVQA
jgi:hypothetical protein